MNIGKLSIAHSFNRYKNTRSLLIPTIAFEREEMCNYRIFKFFLIIGKYEFSYAFCLGFRPKQTGRQRWEVKE